MAILNEDYPKILYSVNRAQLGHITPNLRVVQVTSQRHAVLDVIFTFNENPSEIEKMLANLTVNKISLDFASYEVNLIINVVEYPKRPPNKEVTTYWRNETSM